jgi:hypothetical protein
MMHLFLESPFLVRKGKSWKMMTVVTWKMMLHKKSVHPHPSPPCPALVVTNGNPEYLSPGHLMGFESALIFVSTYMFFSK